MDLLIKNSAKIMKVLKFGHSDELENTVTT